MRSDLEVVDEKTSQERELGTDSARADEAGDCFAILCRRHAPGSQADLSMPSTSITKHLPAGFPIDDVVKLKVLEADFRAKSAGGLWEGQVGALDGVHFGMQLPATTMSRIHASIMLDMYALLCMAICDAQRRILWWDISHTPTTHDSQAWECTELGWRIVKGELPEPFFLSGDSALSLSNSMITPSDDSSHDDCNCHQSSNRMPIECAFGLLIRRWGELRRPLAVKFERRACLISALIRLHNFVLTRTCLLITSILMNPRLRYSRVVGTKHLDLTRWAGRSAFDQHRQCAACSRPAKRREQPP